MTIQKKAKSHKELDSELEKELPRVFVVGKGNCSPELSETVHDMRKCLYPNTAMKLEDKSKMPLKTYMRAARVYNVTHLIVLQHLRMRDYLRVVKLGGGEMIFRIVNFCRMKDVLHEGGQPFSFSFKDPLVVLNNFTDSTQTKMIGKALQELFPPINPEKVKPDKLKRVVSFTFSSKKKMIYLRHYKVVLQEGSGNNSLSQLISNPNADLSGFSSLSECLDSLKGHRSGEESHDQQSRVRLVEMGPRMKLKFLNYREKCDEQLQGGKPVQLENPEMGGEQE